MTRESVRKVNQPEVVDAPTFANLVLFAELKQSHVELARTLAQIKRPLLACSTRPDGRKQNLEHFGSGSTIIPTCWS